MFFFFFKQKTAYEIYQCDWSSDVCSSDLYYYVHDHLYSPVALFEDDGTIAERYEYDAYGNMTMLDHDFTTFSGTEAGNPYYFTSRRLDTLDGGDFEIMYYRFRYYKPSIGRFMQNDPLYNNDILVDEFIKQQILREIFKENISHPIGINSPVVILQRIFSRYNGSGASYIDSGIGIPDNLYLFVGNNPLLYTDPLGLSRWSDFWESIWAGLKYLLTGSEVGDAPAVAYEVCNVSIEVLKQNARYNNMWEVSEENLKNEFGVEYKPTPYTSYDPSSDSYTYDPSFFDRYDKKCCPK